MSVQVSIIIPTYNYGHFLPDALESLRRQTFTDWECIIVDDGSTDDTARIAGRAEKEDPRFFYVPQHNQGQPVARNTGIALASGQYIQFLDSDDLLQPEKLKIQVDFLERHPETDIVYGKARYFETGKEAELFADRWGHRMQEWMPMISGKGEPMVRAMAEKNILELGCALFRIEAIEKTGRFEPSAQGVEDYFYCFRAAVAGCGWHFLEAPQTCVVMRHHPGSFSKNRPNSFRKELQTRLVMRNMLKKMGDKDSLAANEEEYARRLRRLQDLLIDQTIKSGGKMPQKDELEWMLRHSSVRQNLYFFPRIVKAMLFRQRAAAQAI
jgi:glycosyltransferase involved in cell wall biosynthesis